MTRIINMSFHNSKKINQGLEVFQHLPIETSNDFGVYSNKATKHHTYRAIIIGGTITIKLRRLRIHTDHTRSGIGTKPRRSRFLWEGTIGLCGKFTKQTGIISNGRTTITIIRSFIIWIRFTSRSIFTS